MRVRGEDKSSGSVVYAHVCRAGLANAVGGRIRPGDSGGFRGGGMSHGIPSTTRIRPL